MENPNNMHTPANTNVEECYNEDTQDAKFKRTIINIIKELSDFKEQQQ